MTLTTLIIMIGSIALLLTLLVGLVLKEQKSWLMTYLQNFTGALFVFSGFVKAIDPLGTAYKMEQYFAEFETTFDETFLSFLAPLFPWLSNYAIAFSVIMIVFEIVLGIMLLIGAKPKFTSWAFFSLVAFFTALTGFTYLTGYVPQDVNFFNFSNWGPYVDTNMKVTDCGCFGDFLKLEPRVSFLKDVFLLVPAIYFLFRRKDMHQLGSPRFRTIATAASAVIFTIYSLSNYVWDIPHIDFRPFATGKNVAQIRQAEQEAAANVKILAYKLTNKQSGEVTELPYDQFLKDYKSYPKEEWEYDQISSEPAIEATKISDFDVTSVDGENMTEAILSEPGYSFMVVCYKFYYDTKAASETVRDTTFVTDTVSTGDTILLVQKIGDIQERTINKDDYIFEDDYREVFMEKINPLASAAEAAGLKVYGVVGGAGSAMIDDFRHDLQAPYPFYEADDILLKTIVRSNPGVVLWKDGTIVAKWHHKKLPSFEEIQRTYMK